MVLVTCDHQAVAHSAQCVWLARVGATPGDKNGLWSPACSDHGANFGFNHSKLSTNGVGLKEAMMN
jgi:hypothetical protein